MQRGRAGGGWMGVSKAMDHRRHPIRFWGSSVGTAASFIRINEQPIPDEHYSQGIDCWNE